MYWSMGDILYTLILLVTPNSLLPSHLPPLPNLRGAAGQKSTGTFGVGVGLLRPRGLFQAPEMPPRNPMIPCVLQSTNASSGLAHPLSFKLLLSPKTSGWSLR